MNCCVNTINEEKYIETQNSVAADIHYHYDR